jgi:hypothetical protein
MFPFYTNLVGFNGRVFSPLAFEGSAGTCLIKICLNTTVLKFCIATDTSLE